MATDNVEAGRRLGEYARTIVDKDDKIAVISHVKGVSTAVEREQGFREGLGDYADNIVEVVYCNSLFDRSYKLAKELMEKYPDLKMIAGMNEYSSVGAARAVKEADAKGEFGEENAPFIAEGDAVGFAESLQSRHVFIYKEDSCEAESDGDNESRDKHKHESDAHGTHHKRHEDEELAHVLAILAFEDKEGVDSSTLCHFSGKGAHSDRRSDVEIRDPDRQDVENSG